MSDAAFVWLVVLTAVVDGSPYQNPSLVVPSPGARNWPPSPSVPGPSPSSRIGTALSPSHSREPEHRTYIYRLLHVDWQCSVKTC